MKKNRLMRIAALMLVLTLATSCFVGGTFAKYVSTTEATDTARVAEWGIELMATGNLFGANYNPNDALDSLDDDVIGLVTTSVSGGAENVVAPGTKNDVGLTVAITGTPEVSYETTASADAGNKEIVLKTGHWGVLVEATGLNDATDVTKYYVEDITPGNYVKAAGDWSDTETYFELRDYVHVTADYYPIDWKLNGAAVADLATAMGTMVTGIEAADGDANTSPALSYTLTWAWPFTGVNDEADTILGNLFTGNADAIVVFSTDNTTYVAAPAEKYCLTNSVGITVTVQQTN